MIDTLKPSQAMKRFRRVSAGEIEAHILMLGQGTEEKLTKVIDRRRP